MDTLQDRGHKEEQRLRLEADLAASIETLFRRCPSLYGFSVQEASKISRERAVDRLNADLYLADLACHPSLDEEHCAELCEVVSHTLLELVDERPEMAEILSGRTFARTLH
jgi:spore coat polysaccharide biosynthesis protein SpsF (cytidylyltransferase family)